MKVNMEAGTPIMEYVRQLESKVRDLQADRRVVRMWSVVIGVVIGIVGTIGIEVFVIKKFF